MSSLNFKHLRYFWMVARTGSIAKAAEQLHLTPHHRLLQWLERTGLHPRIVGEFDDSAMIKACGQAGAGVVFAPTVIAEQVGKQYGVVELGQVATLVEQVYAITTERRMSHPATVAISQTARRGLFV